MCDITVLSKSECDDAKKVNMVNESLMMRTDNSLTYCTPPFQKKKIDVADPFSMVAHDLFFSFPLKGKPVCTRNHKWR